MRGAKLGQTGVITCYENPVTTFLIRADCAAPNSPWLRAWPKRSASVPGPSPRIADKLFEGVPILALSLVQFLGPLLDNLAFDEVLGKLVLSHSARRQCR